jgi:hypothetical protein
MARQSHKPDEDVVEYIQPILKIIISPEMQKFLSAESRRLSTRTKRPISSQGIIRALIAAYYEKRMIGLLVNPDD